MGLLCYYVNAILYLSDEQCIAVASKLCNSHYHCEFCCLGSRWSVACTRCSPSLFSSAL